MLIPTNRSFEHQTKIANGGGCAARQQGVTYDWNKTNHKKVEKTVRLLNLNESQEVITMMNSLKKKALPSEGFFLYLFDAVDSVVEPFCVLSNWLRSYFSIVLTMSSIHFCLAEAYDDLFIWLSHSL